MSHKLLFLDLDGTMILPGTFDMPHSTQEALSRARAAGHKAIICTGRNMGAIRPLLSYGFDGIIASAGGYIQLGDDVINNCTLSDAERSEAFRILKDNGFYITAETFDHMYIDEDVYPLMAKLGERSGNSELERLKRAGDSRLHCRPLTSYAGEPVYKILLLCEEESQFEVPRRLLGEHYSFIQHAKDKDGIINGELISKRFSKGKALKMVTEYYGCTIADTIGFGDSMNDLEMFKEAGCSVCMGDGPDRLKALVDHVCPKQKDDGLYHAFTTLNLI